jgi:2-phosphosulfolactate phosphatase
MVISGDFRNCRAVADWILARQVAKGDRVAVAVVASGATRADGSRRFAVEDFLASGAIVDALSTLGIDYCSPEAAAACAAFTGLRSAVAHVLTASESGAEVEASERTSLRVLGTMNCSTEVRELTE